MCPHVCSPHFRPACERDWHYAHFWAKRLPDYPARSGMNGGWNEAVNDRKESERGAREAEGERERERERGGRERETGRERRGATWRLSAAERLNRRGGAGLQLCQLLMCCPLVCGLFYTDFTVAGYCHVFCLKWKHRYPLMSSPLPGGNMLYSQSSFPWSPLQWCSWKAENIQVDHEAGQHLTVWQALG